jgi:citronellol/citronellal dehydrogenase
MWTRALLLHFNTSGFTRVLGDLLFIAIVYLQMILLSCNLIILYQDNTMALNKKNILITGASRGIGKAIAIRLAAEGANIAIASKTVEQHPKLEGTIYTAAEEIDKAGDGKVLALQADIREYDQILEAVKKTAEAFGGIDVLINNASAINLSSTEQLEVKRYDLMQDINVRGTFLMSQACIPFLKESSSAHILNISPPLNMDRKWFPKHLAYTISKYGMSMIALGLSAELKKYRIAVNALWPKTTIATAAVQNLLGGDELVRHSRKPDIVADAAFIILSKPFEENSGNFYIDEDVLRKDGVENFDRYAVTPGVNLMPDLFL